MNGYKFRRQHPIGPFIVDFYCSELKLVVELEGSVHNADSENYDRERQAFLENKGLKVLYLLNEFVISLPAEGHARIQSHAPQRPE